MPDQDVPDQDVPDQDVPDQDGVDRILRQWQRERPDLDTSPMGVIGRVSRLSRQLEQRLDPVFARHGLEQGLFDVLATLRRSGEPYRMRPADLAASVMLTSSGITKRLDRLEASGYTLAARDVAWPAFEAARATYSARLEAMASYWATPAAQWLGDPVTLRQPLHPGDDP